MLVFGGPLSPLGDGIAFVELGLDAAVDAYREWGAHWPKPPTLTALPEAPLEELLRALLPLEMRHRRRLLVGTTTGWTAVFDNGEDGGDPFPPTYLAEIRGVRAVAATHTDGPVETCPATQFHLFGPEGEPPLLYVRTIDAGVFDEGRWHFETWGAVQPFEETEAYASRRVRDASTARCSSATSPRSMSTRTIRRGTATASSPRPSDGCARSARRGSCRDRARRR